MTPDDIAHLLSLSDRIEERIGPEAAELVRRACGELEDWGKAVAARHLGRSMFVAFRGEEEEVRYIDHGYESDTNVHEVEWWLADPTLPEPTEEEYDRIDQHIREVLSDWRSDPDFD